MNNKKKNIIIILLCFLLANECSFASGIYSMPQSQRDSASASKPTVSEPIQVEKVLMPQDKPKRNFELPFARQKNCIKDESKKTYEKNIPKVEEPLKIGTSADVVSYKKISMQEAIDYALKNNLDIKGNRINVDIGKNDIKKANQLRNPYIQYFFNGGKAATDNPNNAGLIFPIDIAKRGARKRLAKSNLDLTKGNVALAELMLRLDVRQAYVDLVSAKSTLKILNDQKKLLQDLLDISQKKYDVGAVPLMDVIHAKMTLNQLLIQVNSANTDVMLARYDFNKVLNSQNFDAKEEILPEQKEFTDLLTPRPLEKSYGFDELADIMVKNRLDLKNAQKDVEVAQKNLTLVIRQRVPDIEIGGGVIFVPSQLSTSDEFTKGYYVGGNITNIPLLYQYSPEIKNAKLQVEQKLLALASQKKQAMMDLHSAYDTYIMTRDNLNYYNDILLSESKQFLNMSKRSYVVGKSNITDFIFIQQSYKSIIMGYIEALSDYYGAWIDLLREVNDEGLNING